MWRKSRSSLTSAFSLSPRGGGYRLCRRIEQASTGKNGRFRPMYLPNLLLHPLAVWGFVARMQRPHLGFVVLRSGLCLRLPSDSTSRWTPLPLASGW